MTIKFFSLWFLEAVQLGPTAVSLVSALGPLGVAAASLACQRSSKPLGRVQLSLLTRALDVALLLALAFMPVAGPGAVPRPLLICVHLTRMAVANATRPLMRSVLMDFVPRRHRAKARARLPRAGGRLGRWLTNRQPAGRPVHPCCLPACAPFCLPLPTGQRH